MTCLTENNNDDAIILLKKCPCNEINIDNK